MAICRIGGNPGDDLRPHARSRPTDAARGRHDLHHRPPGRQPKRIEAGPTHDDLTAISIRYNDIDTLGGNSGSGILRGQRRPAGRCPHQRRLQCRQPGRGGSNFGQRIAAVIAASPTLQAPAQRRSPRSRTTRSSQAKLLDDPVTLKFSDDAGKPKLADDPMLEIADDGRHRQDLDDPVKLIPGRPETKVTDDPKLKFSDDPAISSKIADDPVKTPAHDKPRPTAITGSGGPPLAGPAGSGRPFILATPHHSDLWQRRRRQQAAGRLAEI